MQIFKIIKNKIKKLLKIFIFRKIKISNKFKTERAFLKTKLISKSNHQSILFFTTPKAASCYMGNIMKKLCKEAGLVTVDLDAYFYTIGKQSKWLDAKRISKKASYQPSGYFFGPFRSVHKGISNLDSYKILIVVRDPRDVLVSNYFSICYSHGYPPWPVKES
ncbi:MAG: sulfotransferase family 2 domain-containing protein [Candidatus Omnitrophota bacterium]